MAAHTVAIVPRMLSMKEQSASRLLRDIEDAEMYSVSIWPAAGESLGNIRTERYETLSDKNLR